MNERWQADDAEMRRRSMLADRVESELEREAQETGISMLGDDSRFLITTYRPSIVRKLLRHSYAEIEWLYCHDGDGNRGRIDSLSELDSSHGGRRVEGLCAHMPVAALTIKGSPRQRDAQSKVANTPEDVANLQEVFGDDE